MPYCGPMCYAMQFPAHQLGGRMELCVIRGYALSEVCVMRGSTVYTSRCQAIHEACPSSKYNGICEEKHIRQSKHMKIDERSRIPTSAVCTDSKYRGGVGVFIINVRPREIPVLLATLEATTPSSRDRE
ncbi:hypothetical protein BDZ97DRAFT_429223 [Flammula alnicola]|nr:hypothetical protein BDZ97DRAFT_429223 [Flammula alnicola]